MKVAIQDAMERGATRLASIGGEGQINRYPSMVKYVDNVDLIYAHDNRKLYDLTVTYLISMVVLEKEHFAVFVRNNYQDTSVKV